MTTCFSPSSYLWCVPAVPTNRYHAFRYLQCLSLYALALWRVFTCFHLTRVAEGLTLFVVYSTLLYIIPLTVAAYVGHSRAAMDNEGALVSLLILIEAVYFFVWVASLSGSAFPDSLLLKAVPHDAMDAYHYEQAVEAIVLDCIIFGYLFWSCCLSCKNTMFSSRSKAVSPFQQLHSMSMNVGRLDSEDMERVSRALETSRAQQHAQSNMGRLADSQLSTSRNIQLSIPSKRIPIARAEAMFEGVVTGSVDDNGIEMGKGHSGMNVAHVVPYSDQFSNANSVDDWMSLLRDHDFA